MTNADEVKIKESVITFSQQLAHEEEKNLLKRNKVVVYTATAIFTGYTYRRYKHRLSDAINDGILVDQRQVAVKFLPLVDVETILHGEKREYATPFRLISKADILFIAEELKEPSKVPSAGRPRVYPFKEKKSVGARVSLPPYQLIGQMHVVPWQQLINSIDVNSMFIPMTGVVVLSNSDIVTSKFNFVLANTHRILYVDEQ